MPREFSNIFITLVYIPPSANKNNAAEYIINAINDLATEKPDSLQIVLGDVNRCVLKLYNFVQYVNCPTRDDQILDHFYCNEKNSYRSIQGAPLKNSDHNMIYMEPTYVRKLKRAKPKEIEISELSDDNLDILNASFDHTNWEMFIEDASDIDELTDVVSEYIKFNIEMIIPKKSVKVYPNNKPWINSKLRKQIVDKHFSYSNNEPDYSTIQQNVNDSIANAKLDYKDKIENMFNKNKMKDAWKGLRIITGKEKSKKESPLTSTIGSADRLNKFYARFDDKDFSEIQTTMKEELIEAAKEEEPVTITEDEVIQTFNKLNTRKACGPDKISALILKKCLSSLSSIIHYMFQLSTDMFRMPNVWKIGEIVPVSKKTLPVVDNDLRPITLTPIISKCYERIMLPKLMEPVSPHMDNLQFAYLKLRCTEDAVNTLLHELSQHLDKPSTYARCLFIDYSSAFNTMQPHILLEKLARYNVSARLQLWVLDFLTNRMQFVKTSSEQSSTIIISTGGPQGCVISAFLFIIYTNDMINHSRTCKVIKYADDTVVIGLVNDNDESEYRDTIDNVASWCSANFLDLNVSKTKEMIIDFRRNQNKKDPIHINDSEVDIVSSYKYLGVTIQDDLKWDTHVDMQLKKANKRMYHVRCLKKLYVDHHIITMFYNSIVSSLLSYALSCFYNGCSKKLKKCMDKPRRKVCKMLQHECHTNVESLHAVYEKKCKNLAAKIMKDTTHPLHAYFNFLPHGQRLDMPYCRTARLKNTFVPSSIKLYNSN